MEEKPLFTDLTSEESAAVSGGIRVRFDLDTYLFILGAGILFGNPGLTSDEIQFAWKYPGLTSDEIQFAWKSAFVFEDSPRSRKTRDRRLS